MSESAARIILVLVRLAGAIPPDGVDMDAVADHVLSVRKIVAYCLSGAVQDVVTILSARLHTNGFLVTRSARCHFQARACQIGAAQFCGAAGFGIIKKPRTSSMPDIRLEAPAPEFRNYERH